MVSANRNEKSNELKNMIGEGSQSDHDIKWQVYVASWYDSNAGLDKKNG